MKAFLKPSFPSYDAGMKCWAYPEKPDGMKAATEADLINSDGSIKANTQILEYCKRIDVYYAWKVPEYFSPNAIREMISENSIYIKQ